jgi:hypothetical protein
MRFASNLFAVIACLLVASVGFLSLRQRGLLGGAEPGRPAHASVLIEPANEAALRRLDAKCAVARRLIDGELTLLEAAAWYRYIDEAMPPAGDLTLPGEEGLSEGERYCRMAIRWAGPEARQTSPSRAEAVASRLAAELEQLRRAAAIELPQPH